MTKFIGNMMLLASAAIAGVTVAHLNIYAALAVVAACLLGVAGMGVYLIGLVSEYDK